MQSQSKGIGAIYGWLDTGGTYDIASKVGTPVTMLSPTGSPVDSVTLNGPWTKGGSKMLKETCQIGAGGKPRCVKRELGTPGSKSVCP